MTDAISGALVAMNLMAGLLFLRFWRDTRDRLFGMFAAAFALLAVQRALLLAYRHPAGDEEAGIYLVRLAAFLLILDAIVDKNRGAARPD